jgi:hypothetical protein
MRLEKLMNIPFTTEELILKQVRFEKLEPLEKDNLQFFFPGYSGKGFSPAAPGDGYLEKVLIDKGFKVFRDDNVPRRYAGDFSLPRSRYHTVCRNLSGDDGGTIINELRAYSSPNESGYVVVVDSTGSDEASTKIRSFLKPGAKAILCLPRDTSNFPSPYAHFVGVDRTQQPGQLAAVIPLAVTKQRIERLIDLRKPDVQTWFTRELTNLREPVNNEPCFPLAGPLDDFSKLLPTLLAQSVGDNRKATQVAGLWLRRIGANALIFPSARSNTFTQFLNGDLIDWVGWNLVDYRGAPAPEKAGHIDLSPEWDQYPTYGHYNLSRLASDNTVSDEVAPFLYERVRISNIERGPEAGSLRIEGLEEEREHFRGFQIWMHFLEQIRKKYAAIDADRLLHASLTLVASKDGKVDIAGLSQVAQRFCFAILGEPDDKEMLRYIAAYFEKAGDKRTATAIARLLHVCA